jgi:hypothetical protein
MPGSNGRRPAGGPGGAGASQQPGPGCGAPPSPPRAPVSADASAPRPSPQPPSRLWLSSTHASIRVRSRCGSAIRGRKRALRAPFPCYQRLKITSMFSESVECLRARCRPALRRSSAGQSLGERAARRAPRAPAAGAPLPAGAAARRCPRPAARCAHARTKGRRWWRLGRRRPRLAPTAGPPPRALAASPGAPPADPAPGALPRQWRTEGRPRSSKGLPRRHDGGARLRGRGPPRPGVAAGPSRPAAGAPDDHPEVDHPDLPGAAAGAGDINIAAPSARYPRKGRSRLDETPARLRARRGPALRRVKRRSTVWGGGGGRRAPRARDAQSPPPAGAPPARTGTAPGPRPGLCTGEARAPLGGWRRLGRWGAMRASGALILSVGARPGRGHGAAPWRLAMAPKKPGAHTKRSPHAGRPRAVGRARPTAPAQGITARLSPRPLARPRVVGRAAAAPAGGAARLAAPLCGQAAVRDWPPTAPAPAPLPRAELDARR